MRLTNAIRYETYIIIGIFMVIATFSKLIFHMNIDSDWFWFLAGIGLVIEGAIDLSKHNQFKNKFQIIPRDDSKNKNL